MPVPFPDDANVLVMPPDAAEARTIAGGVANAVAADGELTGLQRLLLEALIESMTTFVVPVRNVPRLGPAEFAAALARRSEPFRQRMLQLMLVLRACARSIAGRGREAGRGVHVRARCDQ